MDIITIKKTNEYFKNIKDEINLGRGSSSIGKCDICLHKLRALRNT